MKTSNTSRLGAGSRLCLALTLATVPIVGCSAGNDLGAEANGGDGGGDGGINPGVGQGGAQDFGQFREILLDGEIPGPETIDDVGFFNEHKIELPSAECGENVCLHGQLGVMGNMINGSNCTVVLMGLNTPIDPEQLERPPLNLAVAVDVSGSMGGEPIQYVREGLHRMADSLHPEDVVSIVAFSDDAEAVVEYASGDSEELIAAIDGLQADGATNIYSGLREAYDVVALHAEAGLQNRVILLSDGLATEGITSDAKIQDMSAAYNEIGYGLTTIGVGSDFDVELMRSLSEQGAGAFYFLEDPQAVVEVFEEEVDAFLVPIAQDARIDIDITEGWDLRNVYGTKRFDIEGNAASIDIASLQIAHRESADDNDNGRRGGGGAMLLELLPTGVEVAGEVGSLGFSYIDPESAELITQDVTINSPLDPWETPDNGYFAADGVQKSFVMLNIFVGFQMAAELAAGGQDTTAWTVLTNLKVAVNDWLADNPDYDIEDDLKYIDLFLENLDKRSEEPLQPEPVPPEPWPAD